MATEIEPEIILYDLACIKNVCFSPVVWRIRMILNYKKIPYKTVFLEFPDIEPTLKGLGISPSQNPTPYTVPAIYHLPTNTHIMESLPIAQFLTTTYPSPPLPLTSPLGTQIETLSRKTLAISYRASLLPREIHILSPESQAYFRRTREAALGHKLEDLLEGDREERAWEGEDGVVKEGLKEVGELLERNKDQGRFILGREPSYTDFFIAGSLQCARVVHEGTWERMLEVDGFRRIYEACEPFMERKD